MRNIIAAIVCLLALFQMSACAKKSERVTAPTVSALLGASSAPAPASVPRGQMAIASPTPTPTPPFGTIDFRPDLMIVFRPVCSVAPAGKGPHSGYSLSFGQSSQISRGGIRVPIYAGADGTYYPDKSLFSITLIRTAGSPVQTIAPANGSSLNVSIRNHGLSGFALVQDFLLNDKPALVGTITWACTKVTH